jgi:hypothetical protein
MRYEYDDYEHCFFCTVLVLQFFLVLLSCRGYEFVKCYALVVVMNNIWIRVQGE